MPIPAPGLRRNNVPTGTAPAARYSKCNSIQPTRKETIMNVITRLFSALVLSLLVSVSALAAGKVDINRDSAAAMAAGLNGIGPAKAEAIVAHREKNGPFKSADQLVEVRGIGLATVEKNRDVIVLGSSAPAAAPATATASVKPGN
jgi:competence protein ComEA